MRRIRSGPIISALRKGDDSPHVQPWLAVGGIPNGWINHIGASQGLNGFNIWLLVDNHQDISKDVQQRRRVMSIRRIPATAGNAILTIFTVHGGKVYKYNLSQLETRNRLR